MAAWVLIFWLGGYTSPVTVEMPSYEACKTAFAHLKERGSPTGTLWGYCMDRTAPTG